MNFAQRRQIANITIPEVSDRSTECESLSPELTTKKLTNTNLEEIRNSIKGSLFSRGDSSHASRDSEVFPVTRLPNVNRKSQESNTNLTNQIMSEGAHNKESGQRNSNLELYRQRMKKSLFQHTEEDEGKDVVNSLQNITGGQGTSKGSLFHISSKGSIMDETCLDEQSRNDENYKGTWSRLTIEEASSDPKSMIRTEESLADEYESEANYENTKNQKIIRPIFHLSKEKEIENLKQDLQVVDDPNIHFIHGDFKTYYKEKEFLGEGTTGTVKRYIKKSTNVAYAVKTIHYKNDEETLRLVIQEFKNHQLMNHKNIIKVYELYVDYLRKKIHTVMEYADCKEMFEVIKNLGHYSEAVASGIFKQVLTGINYLHLNGVCHRDLKPHNLLVSKDGKIVKITDFNVSKFVDSKSKKYSALSTANYTMWTQTGTVAFTAPEMFEEGEYTEAVDMWSAGTVLYTMLCGYQPFKGEYVQDLIQAIKEADFDFEDDSWNSISDEAKDLIQKCLNPDPKTRCSPSEALMHPWIANQGKVSDTSIKVKEMLGILLPESRPRVGSTPKITQKRVSISAANKGETSVIRRRSVGVSPEFKFYSQLKKTQEKRQSLVKMMNTKFDNEFAELHPCEEVSPTKIKKKSKLITDKDDRFEQLTELEVDKSSICLDYKVEPNNEFVQPSDKKRSEETSLTDELL